MKGPQRGGGDATPPNEGEVPAHKKNDSFGLSNDPEEAKVQSAALREAIHGNGRYGRYYGGD
jgi:hypothetical protein